MNRTLPYAAVVPLVLSLVGCKEDLGSCDKSMTGLEGRVEVVTGSNQVMYLGQAVLATACATGCHSSSAKGAARQGAPAGLDFDLYPLSGSPTPADLVGLRSRQRKVFDQRYEIWEQVQDGLMPPEGVGAGFKSASPGTRVTFPGCTRGTAFGAFSTGEVKQGLRNWLACSAPIVEANDSALTTGTPGTVGQRLPACAPDTGGNDGTIESVYEGLFKGSCVAGCHSEGGSFQALDLSSPEKAYTALTADGAGNVMVTNCDAMMPLVTPNDTANSYIFDVLQETPVCGLRMPYGGQMLPQAQIDLVAAWINAGAPGPGQGGTSDAGM